MARKASHARKARALLAQQRMAKRSSESEKQHRQHHQSGIVMSASKMAKAARIWHQA